ncbi:N-acetyl-gamma-glutamyl-phosphate reductase [Anaerobacillus sp. MEB173]|uniref:N-acetyl-gamma-glutamyl-phosphate reductase n=1 Tax=Anaerobacillus sp. MEB173 TaxID=3383345 RepID=UPI003F8DD6AF
MKVAIIGATGYGGAELIRLLHNHPEVELSSIHSSSQYGVPIQDSYGHLINKTDLILEKIDTDQIAKTVDVVFMATPSGISTELSPELINKGVKVIDLSGDLRIKDRSLYEKWYKKNAANDETLKEAIYGLPEWCKEEIKTASLLANPGCYPTAVLLGLAPLIQNKLIERDSLIIDAKSGVTGAGRSPSAVTHYSEMNDNFKIYKVNAHQHIPEIEQMLNRWDQLDSPITFSTHLVPMTRGIMATMYGKATKEMTEEQLRELYNEQYGKEPFVRIRKQGAYPSTKEVYGSNYCDIGVTYDERTGRIMVVSVIDNLMKGAAGQAVQNLNIMMGIDEKTGLDLIPVYP